MKSKATIKEYLTSKNSDRASKFQKLDDEIKSILNENSSLLCKFISQSQVIKENKKFTNLVDSGEITASNITKYNDETAIAMRSTLYSIGDAHGTLLKFLYTRKSAIHDLGTSLQDSLSGMNITSSIVLMRAILEQVANTLYVTNNIEKTLNTAHKNTMEESHILGAIGEIVASKGKGTRIDWNEYLSKSLRDGKKKSYKPQDGTVDVTASDLMKTIDDLDKTIKGARKGYEFASEFAHPNIGGNYIYSQSAHSTKLVDGLII